MENYDFSGWATKANLMCSDGRIILKDAFKHNDGQTVPLVWNHRHNEPINVLGHALLENREEGVYAYCKFNETESGIAAKQLVEHNDVNQLSIYANQLRQNGSKVEHGVIREVSLVLAGANPEAFIDNVIRHNDETNEDVIIHEEADIYTGEYIAIYHADTKDDSKDDESEPEEKKQDGDETVAEVWSRIEKKLSETEMDVVYAMIGQASEDATAKHSDETDDTDDIIEHSEGGTENMKQNAFEQQEVVTQGNVLSHADQESIIAMAKRSNVGSLKEAIKMYAEENDSLKHGLDLGDTAVLEELLPDYKNLNPGAPEILGPDQSWVMSVINKVHKSPYSRIRTRHADARAAELREKLKAKGYAKGEEKTLTEHIKLLGRSFDPQTIYIKDELNRDDIIDITDFSIVDYVWNLMKANMYETLALAFLVGDGREDTDPDKIKEDHICPIWHDNELYTIHTDVDIAAAKAELQGTDTGAHFGENYIYAEAIITAALYSREQFKGSGRPDFYCTPHLVNVMLLARDFNGRRIYDSKADLAKALNVGAIHEIEQFEGKTRTTSDGKTKQLLGIFVNLADYQVGNTKGGEVTRFDQFDIDFNKYKYLMETRLSAALNKPKSAIALEMPVEEIAG